jgi:putative hydrolase of the HAD superfamily
MGLALFDLDNTLLDREAAFARWSREFVGRHGLPEEALPFMVSADQDGMKPKDLFFEQVRAQFDMSNDVEELMARFHLDYPRCYTVDPENIKSLRQLRSRGWKVGIVTNGGGTQLAKLETTDLAREVDAICVSEFVGVRKPDPAIFALAAERCASTLRGWMVGDSVTADIAGGRSVGLGTVWIARGRTWTSADPVPDAIVATVPQAVKIILKSGWA